MPASSKGIFIAGAKRTPFCKYGGPLRELPASYAFAAAAKDAIHSAKIDPELIDETIVGNLNYLSQCDGGKTPRYCGIYSGVPIAKPALGVSKACGTGLQALITGAVDILFGTSKIILTGGTDIMSTLPMLVRNVRFGTALGTPYLFEDHMQREMVDSYSGLTLTKISEELTKKYKIDRKEIDEFALESHLKWKAGQDTKCFADEIASLTVNIGKKDVLVDKDLISQTYQNIDQLQNLPTLLKDGSAVTGGNSSINETFASQVLATVKELDIDLGKVNVNGGALAMGHPVSATGARMATTLVYELRRRNAKRAVAVSSCGAGQGIAIMLETL